MSTNIAKMLQERKERELEEQKNVGNATSGNSNISSGIQSSTQTFGALAARAEQDALKDNGPSKVGEEQVLEDGTIVQKNADGGEIRTPGKEVNTSTADMNGPGDPANGNVPGTVDHTRAGPQDAAEGVLNSKGLSKEDLDPGIGIDPGTGEKFKMPNPLLIREVSGNPVAAAVVGPPGSYKALRLTRFFDQTGNPITPNEDGFFIPKNDWEKQELDIYASQHGMVEKT